MAVRPWTDELTARERDVVREVLHAAADGPFVPESEFSTVLGMDRGEVREVPAEWPQTSDPDRQFAAVNGAMNNLLNYPHERDDAWSNYLSVDREQLAEIYGRVRETSGANEGTRDFLRGELRRLSAQSADGLLHQRVLIEQLVMSAADYGVAVPARLADAVAAWAADGNSAGPVH